jgi:hypothetical protein
VIQLDRPQEGPATSRVHVASDAELAALREQFDRRHAVVLPRLFGPVLLAEVQGALESAPFAARDYDGLAGELALEETVPLVARLLFVMNDPALFRAIEAITGIESLVRFDGRIYRRVARPDHYDNWHTDIHDNRRVTMSVNLSEAPYDGGVLHLRRRGTERTLVELHNTGPGDAILFRIAPEYEHRVTSIDSGVKTALAGWFGDAPPWPLPAR